MKDTCSTNKSSGTSSTSDMAGHQISRTPRTCACGSNFNIEHALTCKRGGFITLRHDRRRSITARLLKEVCHDVRIEPTLQKLTGEQFEQ